MRSASLFTTWSWVTLLGLNILLCNIKDGDACHVGFGGKGDKVSEASSAWVMVGVLTGQSDPSSNPSPATFHLCHVGQLSTPMDLSFPTVKRGNDESYAYNFSEMTSALS